MEEDLGREATDAEVAKSLGVSQKRLTSIQRARRTVSLNAPLYPGRADKAGNADKTPLGDLIEDHHTPSPDELADLSWLQDKMASMLDTARSEGMLTDQDCFVLSLRFGLADRSPKTLEEVGAAMSRTRARAGQLVNEALHKLRASGLCEGLREYAYSC
jgi:RNA polymerase primary sigma factor